GSKPTPSRCPKSAKPPACTEGSRHLAELNLPADGNTGSAARTTRTRTAGAVERGRTGIGNHELDPQRLVIAVVRRLARGAQRIQAVLLHTPVRAREFRKLEDHEGTLVHLLQGKGQRLPRRLDPQLGAAADLGPAAVFEPFAFALQDDRIGNGARLEPAEITGDGQAAHVPRADGRVPGRLHLTALFVGGNAIVDDDVSAGLSGDRAVEVVERSTL